ncbi:hypothetical protein HY385_00180 [Candidatus Daviesbacteria bacterium]|nr:hypothetical protein [Candidatus Daviesbacteria bacterium]
MNWHNIKRPILSILFVLFVGWLALVPSPVFAATSFQTGNIFLVSNTNAPAWMDPVNANVGDVVEFHLEINNTGDEAARNVQVKVDLPTNVSGGTLTTTIHVKADNAPEVTDTATVNVPPSSTAKNLVYFSGHATLIKHPGNVTSSIETIGSGGFISIGDIEGVNNAFAEVLFKAKVTETPTETPTPTPTITVTPTPTPVEANVISCPAGFIKTISGSNIICVQQIQNNNQTVTSTSNASTGEINVTQQAPSVPATVVVPVASAPQVVTKTVTVPVAKPVVTVTELPKTGLPIGAWFLSSLIPVGIGLMRKFRVSEKGEVEDSPYYLSQKRRFFKD